METIKSYLDNMFAGLPKTARIMDLKNDILANMEEKYNELKNQGKSENEAIGVVISEFGNIDELINELGIRKDDPANSKPVVNREEVESYIAAKEKMSLRIGIGVFLCIMSPAALILLSALPNNIFNNSDYGSDSGSILGVIALLIMVAIAVSIFIYSGMRFESFKYMEEGVTIPGSLEAELKQSYDRYLPSFYLRLIIGICMIILSPIVIIAFDMFGNQSGKISVPIFLFFVALAVVLFIVSGSKKECYERLLQVGDYTKAKKEDNKVIGAVASFVWPLAVIIFLVCGLVFDLWYICWIVFPITGILFGMFSAVYSTLKGNHNA